MSSAPTRIDLAGGTLDLWPLHLFFDNPPTVNIAIDLFAKVTLTPRSDSKILIESSDLNVAETFSSLKALPERHPLDIIIRLLKFYRPQKGLRLVTECQAPKGSGIGGSSALNIALNGALNRYTRSRYSKIQMLEIAKNIETQVIDAPAGTQDYLSALNGGAQAIYPEYTGVRCQKIDLDLKKWTERFVLCYSGIPHDSGINNWQIYKQTLDRSPSTLKHLETIAHVSRKMAQDLSKRKYNQFAESFDAEWQARRKLAPGISTKKMDLLIRNAKKMGAKAAKACGAGGGGCIAFYVDSGRKKQVEESLRKNGGEILNFHFVKRGLKIESIKT